METMPSSPPPHGALRAFVGSRTTRQRQARGRGIEVFDISLGGDWQHRHHVPAGDNPSYLLVDPTGQSLYCVHGDGDSLSSFRIQPDGALMSLGTVGTQGRNPVHLALSQSGRWLLVANYASGSVASLPLDRQGLPGEVAHLIVLPDRPGPHRTQQRGAHPHQLAFDPTGRWLLVPDKGGDAVHTLALDESSGALRRVASWQAPPMSGPRHMVFAANGTHAWIGLELSSQVVAARFDPADGSLLALQRTATLPEDFVHENTAAGIALSPDGQSLYVSNRGHGSVVRYAIDATHGTLHKPSWIDALGKVPRFIAHLPGRETLLVANEDADSIVGIAPLASQALPVASTGSPVCIAFIPVTQGTP